MTISPKPFNDRELVARIRADPAPFALERATAKTTTTVHRHWKLMP